MKVKITIIHSLDENRERITNGEYESSKLVQFEGKLNEFLVEQGFWHSSETSEFSPKMIQQNPDIYYNRLSQTYHLSKKPQEIKK